MKKLVILYSGGLDSLIMKKYAEEKFPDHEVKCIYYKHGADSEEQEIAILPDFVEVRTVDWLDDNIRPQPKLSDPYAGAIYIPGRNMVFATLAACQELPDRIWMGTLSDENNYQATDKNFTFLKLLNDTIKYVLSPFKEDVVVEFPFCEHEDWTKLQAVKWATSRMSQEEIKKSVSCWFYNSEEHKPCGSCKQCFKRYLVFTLSGIEPEEHMIHPLESEEGRRLFREYFTTSPMNEDEKNVKEMINNFLVKAALTPGLVDPKLLEGLIE